MQDNKPRLIDTGTDGETRKSEELEGQDITILKAINTRMPDGRDAAKWAVRLADGSTGIFWGAGQDPIMKVGVWFMQYPTTPLPCRLFRRANKHGTQVWYIEQRDEDGAGENTAPAPQTLDAQLSEIGL